MATVKQIPWRVDIVVTIGDDWSVSLDWDLDATGYTWEAGILESDGTTTHTITVNTVDASLGQYTLTMADTITDAITATDKTTFHSWFLRRTNAGSERMWVGGKVYAIPYYEV